MRRESEITEKIESHKTRLTIIRKVYDMDYISKEVFLRAERDIQTRIDTLTWVLGTKEGNSVAPNLKEKT